MTVPLRRMLLLVGAAIAADPVNTALAGRIPVEPGESELLSIDEPIACSVRLRRRGRWAPGPEALSKREVANPCSQENC